jgi:hypothetical protein
MVAPRVRDVILGAYDASTTRWANAVVAAGSSVGTAQKRNVDRLIRSLKSSSLFSVHDRIWLFASENTTQATIDIVNLATATNSSATHTASQGFAGNASTTFVDTGFAGSTNGVNYTQNSASLSCYVRTSRATAANKAAVSFHDDAGTGRASRFFPHATGSVIIGGLNIGNTFPQTASTNAQGFYTFSRTASTTTEFYKNSSSTSIFSDATASTALVSTTFYVGAEHKSSGGNTFFSDDQVAIVAFGAGLTGAQAAQFQTILNDYMKRLGTNVY